MVPVVIVSLVYTFPSCKTSGGKGQTFCDTTCNNDSMIFVGQHELKPNILISFKDCEPDTLSWSYKGMGVNRKMAFADLATSGIRLSTGSVRAVFNDTSYAWLLFNDCFYGRGFYLKIPFSKTSNISRSGRAINSIDRKFNIDKTIAAYTDKGNIFIEDMFTGKTAMMTFGKQIDFDPDDIHSSIDSVHITPSRIWARVKVDGAWKDLEKSITLE
jgi:hypothetical protein